jgi:hypothetical protein
LNFWKLFFSILVCFDVAIFSYNFTKIEQTEAKVMGAQQFILAFSMIWDLKSLDREMISTVALRKTEFFGDPEFNYDSE